MNTRAHCTALASVILTICLVTPMSSVGQLDVSPSRLPVHFDFGTGGAASRDDIAILRTINSWDGAFARATLGGANATSWPAFVLSGPAIIGAGFVFDCGDCAAGSVQFGLSVIAAEALTAGSTMLLKSLIRRERPFRTVDGITLRTSSNYSNGSNRFSLPSGHAAIASTITASLIFSGAEWFLVAPVATWATLVGLSRVWLGVHFPSDVLAGALVGTLSALVVNRVLIRG